MNNTEEQLRQNISDWELVLEFDLRSGDKEMIAATKRSLHLAKLELRAFKKGEQRIKTEKEVQREEFYSALFAF